jgi:uncharacterized protein YhdP
MDALERVTVFMTVMRQLALVMDEERHLLLELRLDALAEVQADKALLVEAYETELRRLRAEPELIATLDPAVRDELHATMQAFQRTLSDNIDSLVDARERMTGLAQAVDASLERTAGPGGQAAAGERRGQVIRVRFERGGLVRLA